MPPPIIIPPNISPDGLDEDCEEDDEESVTYTFDNNAQPECDEEEEVERKYDPDNHLLMHAMGPNVAGVIGSAVAAGFLLSLFG